MVENSGPVLDLLGDPWVAPRDPRGRKRHKRNAQLAERIAVLAATGVTVDGICAEIGLSEPTLRKYYFAELQDGPRQAQAVLDQVMWKKARAGNVPAAKYMQARFEKGQGKAPVPRRQAQAARLGKKDAQHLEAQTAHEDTEWGDLLKH